MRACNFLLLFVFCMHRMFFFFLEDFAKLFIMDVELILCPETKLYTILTHVSNAYILKHTFICSIQ